MNYKILASRKLQKYRRLCIRCSQLKKKQRQAKVNHGTTREISEMLESRADEGLRATLSRLYDYDPIRKRYFKRGTQNCFHTHSQTEEVQVNSKNVKQKSPLKKKEDIVQFKMQELEPLNAYNRHVREALLCFQAQLKGRLFQGLIDDRFEPQIHLNDLQWNSIRCFKVLTDGERVNLLVYVASAENLTIQIDFCINGEHVIGQRITSSAGSEDFLEIVAAFKKISLIPELVNKEGFRLYQHVAITLVYPTEFHVFSTRIHVSNENSSNAKYVVGKLQFVRHYHVAEDPIIRLYRFPQLIQPTHTCQVATILLHDSCQQITMIKSFEGSVELLRTPALIPLREVMYSIANNVFVVYTQSSKLAVTDGKMSSVLMSIKVNQISDLTLLKDEPRQLLLAVQQTGQGLLFAYLQQNDKANFWTYTAVKINIFGELQTHLPLIDCKMICYHPSTIIMYDQQHCFVLYEQRILMQVPNFNEFVQIQGLHPQQNYKSALFFAPGIAGVVQRASDGMIACQIVERKAFLCNLLNYEDEIGLF